LTPTAMGCTVPPQPMAGGGEEEGRAKERQRRDPRLRGSALAARRQAAREPRHRRVQARRPECTPREIVPWTCLATTPTSRSGYGILPMSCGGRRLVSRIPCLTGCRDCDGGPMGAGRAAFFSGPFGSRLRRLGGRLPQGGRGLHRAQNLNHRPIRTTPKRPHVV